MFVDVYNKGLFYISLNQSSSISAVSHSAYLTLIQPGEVKAGLANFDVKFQTKFVYTYRIFTDFPDPG
jgi:hypothetical protein